MSGRGSNSQNNITDILIAQARMEGKLDLLSTHLTERVDKQSGDIEQLYSHMNSNRGNIAVIQSNIQDMKRQLDVVDRAISGSFTKTMAIIMSLIGSAGIITTIILRLTSG